MRPSDLMRVWCAIAVVAATVLAPIFIVPSALAQEVSLDRWPTALANDQAAMQRGARLFVNYCLNCHSATQMRWNRLRDIGIDEAQIKSQLIFGDQKVGDTMTIAMSVHDAKVWFGKAPPDLSVIVRARNTAEHKGTDYLYTLLRGFYRDRSTLTGWNNTVYPTIAMPNILWQRQGPRSATLIRTEWEEQASADGKQKPASKLVRVVSAFDATGNVQVSRSEVDHGTTGTEVAFTPADEKAAAAFDGEVADLVAFLNWMSEPTAAERYKIGVWVMGFLVVFLLVARWLNAAFWRNIH
ncbi:MAG TPA: cytochrome c1 [Burkholderiaceae bacterium]|nr:cytochrome c1 [Burkholderiaceae bacterium]